MQLIYRAQNFEHAPIPVMPYRKPRALNWRFQVPGETYDVTSIPVPLYCQPRAINWRFRMREV